MDYILKVYYEFESIDLIILSNHLKYFHLFEFFHLILEIFYSFYLKYLFVHIVKLFPFHSNEDKDHVNKVIILIYMEKLYLHLLFVYHQLMFDIPTFQVGIQENNLLTNNEQ